MKSETVHLWLTFGSVGLGILAVLVALCVLVIAFEDDTDASKTIVAILGPTTAVIGTLVGLVAGHSAGSAGKELAEERAETAQREKNMELETTAKLKGLVQTDEQMLLRAQQRLPDLFPK